MWILSRLSNDTKVYLLCDKPKYLVGRNKACDIIAEASQTSLGRFHATLHPYDDRVDIVDTDSKYGTYVNDNISSNVKLEANTCHPLKDGDTIRFGFIDFIWKLSKMDIIVLPSTLTDGEKESLKKDVTILGGRILDQWSDTCTHLIVNKLTFTVKVLQSLCHAIPIVKPEYFKSLLSAIRLQHALPTVESFEPPIVERLVGSSVSLRVNIDRKRLFAGKTFIFMSHRHMEQFKAIIECGMGECFSLDTKKFQFKSLVKPGFIVISNATLATQSQAATQTVNSLNDFLRSKGSRMIPDTEISLAILNCSLNKFCNPKHTLKDNFESNLRVIPSKLLAEDTPASRREGVESTETLNSINVPETAASSIETNVDQHTSFVNLIDDDDDDDMLVQCLDDTMKREENSRGKRKNAGRSSEERQAKKPHLDDHVDDPNLKVTDEESSKLPQVSTRASTRNKSSLQKTVVDKRVEVRDAPQVSTRASSRNKNPLPTAVADKPALVSDTVHAHHSKSAVPSAIPNPQTKEPPQRESTSNNSIHFSLNERPESQHQAELNTPFTQIQNKRKRIAHRPTTSTFCKNDSDSDEDLFQFSKQPSAKKSKPLNVSDSDSDDNINYPLSNGPVAPVNVPNKSIQLQSSQIVSGSWLSRPTPSQTPINTTTRPKPQKQPVAVENPSFAVSASWQIGQHCISSQPIRIPTQGWFSKETIKSKNLSMKKEDENNVSVLEKTEWIDSIRSGIKVITKSMNLVTTGGKTFKKQQFKLPTEVIKTSKIYQF